MTHAEKDKRINGAALEQIMRDVLHGMQAFTEQACANCSGCSLDIEEVHAANESVSPAMQNVIPFLKQGRSG